MSNRIQITIDSFWQNTLFKVLPKKVTPNFFTYIRLILIPAIVYLIAIAEFGWGLIFFIIAAISDTIDGSLARTKKATSISGKILDPIADKMLIILSYLFIAWYYPHAIFLVLVVMFDLLALLAGALFLLLHQPVPPANWLGKSKMVFEVVTLLLVWIYLMSPGSVLLSVSLGAVIISVFLGLFILVFYWVGGLIKVIRS